MRAPLDDALFPGGTDFPGVPGPSSGQGGFEDGFGDGFGGEFGVGSGGFPAGLDGLGDGSTSVAAVGATGPNSMWHDALFSGHGISVGDDALLPLAPIMAHASHDVGLNFQPVDPNGPLSADLGNSDVDFDFPFDLNPGDVSINDFFRENGAFRPPAPCSHCARLRLQCFMLNTTDANPNPVNSCSSCVALFRDCSLAERSKRSPSRFETLVPVIGHLHGVQEEGSPDTWDQAVEAEPEPSVALPTTSIPVATSKRSSSRSVRKTQVLRDWFSRNLNHPYPSEDEKIFLAQQAGLSKTQVMNWFTNARRRHRMTAQALQDPNALHPQGSPMPQSFMSGMTPFERWRQSPPDDEPVSESVIKRALGSNESEDGGAGSEDMDRTNADGNASSVSGDSAFGGAAMFQPSSEGSAASSCFSYLSADGELGLSRSALAAAGRSPSNWAVAGASRPRKPRASECKFCSRKFTKRYDCLRHEASVHNAGVSSWTCAVPLPPGASYSVWRVNHSEPECIFCGHESPTEEHFHSHEFEACAKRAVSDRSFSRKDHLWQHLFKFHGCRKWEGWKPNLNLLQHK